MTSQVGHGIVTKLQIMHIFDWLDQIDSNFVDLLSQPN